MLAAFEDARVTDACQPQDFVTAATSSLSESEYPPHTAQRRMHHYRVLRHGLRCCLPAQVSRPCSRSAWGLLKLPLIQQVHLLLALQQLPQLELALQLAPWLCWSCCAACMLQGAGNTACQQPSSVALGQATWQTAGSVNSSEGFRASSASGQASAA